MTRLNAVFTFSVLLGTISAGAVRSQESEQTEASNPEPKLLQPPDQPRRPYLDNRFYNQVGSRWPERSLAVVDSVAEAQEMAGDLEGAIQTLEQRLQSEGTDCRTEVGLLHLRTRLATQGWSDSTNNAPDLSAARELYAEVAQECPLVLEPLTLLRRFWEAYGGEDALFALERDHEENPDDLETTLRLANFNYVLEHWEACAMLCEELLRADETDLDRRLMFARSLRRLYYNEEAAEQLLIVAEADEDQTRLYYEAAQIYYEEESWDKAIEVAKQGLAAGSNQVDELKTVIMMAKGQLR